MVRAELDGVVITEHDAYWLDNEVSELRGTTRKHKFYFGVEITARDGHVIALGAKIALRGSRERSIEEIARSIDEGGGCAIWVHPFQGMKQWERPALTVHAVEIHSTVTFGKLSEDAQNLALQLGVACVAGSDAHALDHLGQAGVYIDEMPKDEFELAAAIRNGKVRPFRRNTVVINEEVGDGFVKPLTSR
jgi:predicted metal-dependent phosphoesterase TrpH